MNSFTEGRLTQPMRIAIEFPDQHTEDEIDVIVDNWKRIPRRKYIRTQLIIIETITLA